MTAKKIVTNIKRSTTKHQQNDSVNHPIHYNVHPSGVECIDVVEHMSFNLGNVVKYLWREREKNYPIEDLHKALFYLQREIAKRQDEEAC